MNWRTIIVIGIAASTIVMMAVFDIGLYDAMQNLIWVGAFYAFIVVLVDYVKSQMSKPWDAYGEALNEEVLAAVKNCPVSGVPVYVQGINRGYVIGLTTGDVPTADVENIPQTKQGKELMKKGKAAIEEKKDIRDRKKRFARPSTEHKYSWDVLVFRSKKWFGLSASEPIMCRILPDYRYIDSRGYHIVQPLLFRMGVGYCAGDPNITPTKVALIAEDLYSVKVLEGVYRKLGEAMSSHIETDALFRKMRDMSEPQQKASGDEKK